MRAPRRCSRRRGWGEGHVGFRPITARLLVGHGRIRHFHGGGRAGSGDVTCLDPTLEIRRELVLWILSLGLVVTVAAGAGFGPTIYFASFDYSMVPDELILYGIVIAGLENGLNILGFALLAVLAWHIPSICSSTVVGRDHALRSTRLYLAFLISTTFLTLVTSSEIVSFLNCQSSEWLSWREGGPRNIYENGGPCYAHTPPDWLWFAMIGFLSMIGVRTLLLTWHGLKRRPHHTNFPPHSSSSSAAPAPTD
jgi:hypothetical protein